MEKILKKLIYTAVVGIALNLAACGGGGGGSDDSDPSNNNAGGGGQGSTKLASTPQVIDYYGDSTIFGWGNSQGDQVETTAPEAFETALEASSLSANHTVNNKGRNGQTACDLLDGNGGVDPFADQIQASPATTVVILNHGINDSNPDRGISVARYTECLSGLVDIAQAANKRVILETPNPITGHSLSGYLEAMRALATSENLALIDQHAYLTQKYGEDVSAITPDSEHPTAEIYIEKGQYAASEFLKIDR
ncbi:MAG: SGNH/GDSL hydrolase family protein [Burkholderiaceae bacterium]